MPSLLVHAPHPFLSATLLAALMASLVPGRAAGQAPQDTTASSDVPPAPPPAPSFEVSGAPGQGVTLRVGEGYSLNIRSRIQLRYQLAVPNGGAGGQRDLDQLVNVGTARLWLSGHIRVPELTYMIQLAVAGRDFRDGAISPIYDAYLDWRAHRDLSVRAGQFFVPFDRLRTVREWALQMGDRPRPVLELTLDRDMGVMLYSDHFLSDHSPVAWRVGVFGGGGTNLSQGREPGALLVGRVELRPLGEIDDDKEGDHQRRPQPALALGAAIAWNANTNRVRSTTGTTLVGGTTDYTHVAVDLTLKWRGLALQGEYLYRRASVDTLTSLADDGSTRTEYTRSGQGYVVQGSYTFDPPFELVARVSRMFAFAGTSPSFATEVRDRGQELAVGANYYFDSHRLKLQADWVARMPSRFALARADHVVHVQLDLTL